MKSWITISLLLSGCAWQSEVLQLKPDVYQVSANANQWRGGLTEARQMSLSKANAYCASRGKSIDVMDAQSESSWTANGVSTVTFRCE